MDLTDELFLDFPPYFCQYKSGRVVRLRGTDVVPAGLDPATAVASKDVLIDPTTNLSARLYLPETTDAVKLPILVYFHGGAFIIHTAASPNYHTYLNSLAAKAGVLVVSVDYRRAPEHPLPTAHNDSLAALHWAVSNNDAWLAEYADFDRVFLAGDSAGANIAHHVDLYTEVKILGLALVHPFFWGREAVGTETTKVETREYVERLWRVVYPAMEGLDDALINPVAAGSESLKGMRCKRVVVFVAGKDVLRERGRVYCEGLVGSGWGGEAELVEAEGEEHVFHLHDPSGENAVAMMERMVAFLSKEQT